MKLIKLTQGKFTKVDDEDYEWLNQKKWIVRKNKNTYYAESKGKMVKGVRQKTTKMHRLILGLIDPEIFGDHRDRDGLNNQRYNLRVATRSQNGVNRIKKSGTSSKYIGVSFDKIQNKWKSYVIKNKKLIFLGYYIKEVDAAKAYNAKAKELHGEFANLNII